VWPCCVSTPHCSEVEHQMGESEIGSCACMLELCVVDEVKEDVCIFRSLFVDDCVMSLEKLNVEVF
jgi:hypothetical protein